MIILLVRVMCSETIIICQKDDVIIPTFFVV